MSLDGYVVRMKDERLPKKGETTKQGEDGEDIAKMGGLSEDTHEREGGKKS